MCGIEGHCAVCSGYVYGANLIGYQSLSRLNVGGHCEAIDYSRHFGNMKVMRMEFRRKKLDVDRLKQMVMIWKAFEEGQLFYCPPKGMPRHITRPKEAFALCWVCSTTKRRGRR